MTELTERSDANGPLLDQTTVLFGSNLGHANAHAPRDLPILVAGGEHRRGQHIVHSGAVNAPLCNLFVTMLQSMGVETDSFGQSSRSADLGLTGVETGAACERGVAPNDHSSEYHTGVSKKALKRLTELKEGARIKEMLVDFIRRLTSSFVAVSLTLMALSACTSGPMTMAEMVCCADHHDECEMVGQKACCGGDLQSDLGVLAAERSDTFLVAPVASQLVAAPPHQATVLLPLDTSTFLEALSGFEDARSRPSQLSTVLLI